MGDTETELSAIKYTEIYDPDLRPTLRANQSATHLERNLECRIRMLNVSDTYPSSGAYIEKKRTHKTRKSN